MSISDEQLAAMQTEARASSGGGTYVILDEVGDFAAGTVTGIFEEETSFGEVEEVGLVDIRTRYGSLDGERRLRLSRSVLKRELGSESENGAVSAGQSIYVEYHGEATSKQGRQFHRYTVKRFDALPSAPAGDAPASNAPTPEAVKEIIKAELGGEEIPF